MIDNGAESFMRDIVKVHIAYRSPDGTFTVVAPMPFTLGEGFPPGVEVRSELPASMEIPRDLAELLLNALGHAVLGAPRMADRIRDLEQQLRVSERRVDNLIAGIGRLGGNDDRTT